MGCSPSANMDKHERRRHAAESCDSGSAWTLPTLELPTVDFGGRNSDDGGWFGGGDDGGYDSGGGWGFGGGDDGGYDGGWGGDGGGDDGGDFGGW